MTEPTGRRHVAAVSALTLWAALACSVWVHAQGPQPSPIGTFNPGIYLRLPRLENPGAMLVRLDDPTPTNIEMGPVGWDMCGDQVVFPIPTGLALRTATGASRQVAVDGVFRIARPSFSPDCQLVAVQASATPGVVNGAEDLNIYVINTTTGEARRIGDLAWNEESPRFFPAPRNRVVYSSFSPVDGVNLHVYDLDENREVLLKRDIGALQIALSPDGALLLDPRRMRVYSAETGNLLADWLPQVLAALPDTGFGLDERFKNEPGTPNRGNYPLDASFSPAGGEIVLDWAVRLGDRYGNVLLNLTIDTLRLRPLTELIPASPEFTNHNNFSQLNPVWK